MRAIIRTILSVIALVFCLRSKEHKKEHDEHKLEVAESGEEVVVPETKKADAMDVDEPAAAEANLSRTVNRNLRLALLQCARLSGQYCQLSLWSFVCAATLPLLLSSHRS
jgi:muconolactone delta-isomerase